MNSHQPDPAAADLPAPDAATAAGTGSDESGIATPPTAETAAAKTGNAAAEPLRQKDGAWPVVQAAAQAARGADTAAATQSGKAPAKAAAAVKTAKSAKPAKVGALAAPRAPKAKAAAKAAGKAAAKPAATPAKPAEPKPPKKDRAANAAKAVAEPVAAGKPARSKEKLVRDSFTMPRADFALIHQLKERGMGFKREVRKSELLRAGLQALAAMDDAALQALLDKLPKVKTGRPRKGG